MKFLGNILWLILGGIIIAVIYYIVGQKVLDASLRQQIKWYIQN